MPKDLNVFREAAALLGAGEKITLATVAGASGSTPAGPSAKMLIRENGVDTIGTVGGGCLEAGAVQDARIALHTMTQRLVEYELTDDDIESGLICGGLASVLIEPLDQEYLSFFQKLTDMQQDGRDVILVSCIVPGMKPLKTIYFQNSCIGAELPKDILDHLNANGPEILLSEKARSISSETGRTFLLEPIPGLPSLFIFGGGHVSFYIAHFAKLAGFKVIVIDDREKYANPARFPDADATLVSDFDTALHKVKVLPSSFIVIVTRGHAYDERVLENALHTPARYIGMIGSKRKVLLTMQHIEARGMPPEKLNSVFSPLGLDIEAKTPAEIGISIVAELIKVRRKGNAAPIRHMADKVRELRRNAKEKKEI